MMSKLGDQPKAGFDRIASVAPAKDPNELYGIIHENNAKPYDMLEIIESIVDATIQHFEQFKKDYGKTILCGYARIDGWAVGIVANQRLIVKTKKVKCNWVVLFTMTVRIKLHDLFSIATRKKFRLVFLQDVTGFMVGSRSEHAGIIKDGAKTGECGCKFCCAEDHDHYRQQLWCRQLCDVWQGL